MLEHIQSYWAAILLILLFSGVVWAIDSSQTFEQCISLSQTTANNKPTENEITILSAPHSYRACLGAYAVINNPVITALSTLIIAAFTIVLAGATSKQALLTREALVADKRAFVFATGFHPYWELDKTTGAYNWRFRPIWQNSGDTPTKALKLYAACEVRNTILPAGYNFSCLPQNMGNGLIGPKQTAQGGAAPLLPATGVSPQDIMDAQAGRKFIYLWGGVEYFDVFPKTPKRITRFCWQIVANGDPLKFAPGQIPGDVGNLSFGNIHHFEGNCADDECV
jgi:hypothetical protein